MKKLSIIMSFMVVATMFLMISCGGGGSSTPSNVFEKSVANLEKGNYEAVIDCYALDDKELTEEEQQKLEGMLAMGKSEYEKKEGVKGVVIVEEEIAEDGETAKVKYTITFNNDDEDSGTAKFINIDGNWKMKIN